MASGVVYYDPRIEIEYYSQAKPVVKKRSQFRTKLANIRMLYNKLEETHV